MQMNEHEFAYIYLGVLLGLPSLLLKRITMIGAPF